MHDQIAATIEALAVLVEGDGAALEVVETDTASRTALVRLDLSGVACPECVLPHSMLTQMIEAELRAAVGDVRVVLDDPRENATETKEQHR